MTHALKSLAPAVLGVALFAIGGMTPAAAATNQAILNVSAAVTNNCDVLTQPATLTMYFNPVQLIATPGTSSFTYACTNGASVSVTPTSPNVGAPPPQWIAQNSNQYDLYYVLFNDLVCTSNQLSNGASESLGAGTGSSQTYNVCAIPYNDTGIPGGAGSYKDTVTFTFNFGP